MLSPKEMGEILPPFLGVLVGVQAAVFVSILKLKNAGLKRLILFANMAFMFACVVGGAYIIGAPLRLLVPFALLLVVVGAVTLRRIRFCDNCGATLFSPSFKPPTECSKCGAKW